MNLVSHHQSRMLRGCLWVVVTAGLMFAACGQEQTNGSTATSEVLAVDTLAALEDFERLEVEGYVPVYRDENNGVLAVNSVTYPDQYGAAQTQWHGASGTYDVTIETVPEEDGESTYRLFVNRTQVGEFVNPEETEPFGLATHTWNDIKLSTGDTIRVASIPHSNEKIPEGEAYAYSRGRWRHLVLTPTR